MQSVRRVLDVEMLSHVVDDGEQDKAHTQHFKKSDGKRKKRHVYSNIFKIRLFFWSSEMSIPSA